MTEQERTAYAAGWRAGAEKMREACAVEVDDQSMEGHTRDACVASWQEAVRHCIDAIREEPLPPVEYPEAARDGE